MSRPNTDFSDEVTRRAGGCLGWLLSLFGVAALRLFEAEDYGDPERRKARQLGQRGLIVIVLGIIVLIYGFSQKRAYSTAGNLEADAGFFLMIGGVIATIWGIRKLNTPVAPGVHEAVSILPTWTVFTISMPRSTEWNPEKAWGFMAQLVKSYPYIVVRVCADSRNIYWQVVNLVYKGAENTIPNLIRSHYPAAEVKVGEVRSGKVSEPFFRYLAYYQQDNEFVAPIKYVTDIKATERTQVDPLADFTQAVNQLKDGQKIRLTIGFLGSADVHKADGYNQITQSLIHPLQYLSAEGIEEVMFAKRFGFDRVDKYRYEDQRVMEDKLAQPWYYAVCMIQIDAKEPLDAAHLVVQTRTSTLNFSNVPFNVLDIVPRTLEENGLFVKTPDQEQATNALTIYANMLRKQEGNTPPLLVLEPQELANLWHLPHVGFKATRIVWGSGAQEVSECIVRNTEGVVLGKGAYQGGEVEVRLSSKDRNTHVGIIGTTGMGKSTLLHQMIHEDIARGIGVALLDPHGTLVRDILRTSIPSNREQDVVVLDLADQQYPVPLNPLHGAATAQSAGFVADIIESLFEGTENRVKVSKYLNAALITLQVDPQTTMRDIGRLFTDSLYRQALIAKLDEFEHAQALDVWRSLERNMSEKGRNREEEQVYDFMLNRISPFYQKPSLLPILCHPQSVNFRDLMDRKKIILISLGMSRDQISLQERGLVGAIIIAAFHTAVFSGNSQPTEFALYIDELEQFKTTTIDNMLREARKFGLRLTVAHQDLSQVRGSTLDAVKNVGTKICFQSTRDDATHFAPYMTPQFAVEDLVSLDKYTAVVRMQCDGNTQPAFTLRTLPPRTASGDAQATEKRLRELSRANLRLMSLEQVKHWHTNRYNVKATPTGSPEDEYYG